MDSDLELVVDSACWWVGCHIVDLEMAYLWVEYFEAENDQE